MRIRILGAVGLLLAFAVFLVGCERSDVGQNVGPVLENWRYDPNKASESEARKIDYETFEDGNFASVLGFNVTEMPNNNEYRPHKFFTIDGWYGQIEFATGDGRSLVVRVAKADNPTLFSTYQEPHHKTDETRTIDDLEVKVRSADSGSTIATWTRGDFQFLLHSGATQTPPSDSDIETMVKTLRAANA